mmetsp:Transcript_24311/g.51797  ORF Transcript_24311/g.51797 Transcript_24311/m.51797 type:complete len:459 (+) Transcript_24311:180-1556(+)
MRVRAVLSAPAALSVCFLALIVDAYRLTYERALNEAPKVSTTTSAPPATSTSQQDTSDPFYVRKALDESVIRSAVANVKKDALSARNTSLPPKVAFIFLTYKGLQLPSVWDAFFADAPKHAYTIYVHQARRKDANTTELPLTKYGAVRIPQTESAWCAVLGLEVHALTTALNDDHANSQFVFLGDSTVPLKPFEYVQKKLVVDSPDKSKFCLASPSPKKTLYEEFAMDPKFCLFNDFLTLYNPRVVKHHQWMVLSREHAGSLVSHALDGLSMFEKAHNSMPSSMTGVGGCSDEVVPLTTLLQKFQQDGKSTGDATKDMELMGVEHYCTTFVGWMHCLRNTPLSLCDIDSGISTGSKPTLLETVEDLEDDPEAKDVPHKFREIDYDYLAQLVRGESFLFARKFVADAIVKGPKGRSSEVVSLASILPAMWKEPAEPTREQRIWTSLDTLGQPKSQPNKI